MQEIHVIICLNFRITLHIKYFIAIMTDTVLDIDVQVRCTEVSRVNGQHNLLIHHVFHFLVVLLQRNHLTGFFAQH